MVEWSGAGRLPGEADHRSRAEAEMSSKVLRREGLERDWVLCLEADKSPVVLQVA